MAAGGKRSFSLGLLLKTTRTPFNNQKLLSFSVF
jgi:hypothetical protein